MEEKNELSDILLEQKNYNKTTQIKRLIVIAVLLVLLFILVVLIMKFISKPDGDTTIVYPTLNQPNTIKNDDEILVANISTETIEEINVTTNETFVITSTENETIEVENITNVPPVKPTTSPLKTQTTVTPAKSPQKNIVQSAIKSGHYIQIGSFLNSPNKNFLDNIAKKDYEYHLYKTNIKSKQVTIVLIGPYPSETSARDALLDVKAAIAKDAFYKRIQ
jgi:DedD protein